MIKESYLTGAVEYWKFAGEGDDWGAEYDIYELEGVMLREKYSFGEDEVTSAATLLYYFPESSICRGSDGVECALPRADAGDLCVIRGSGESGDDSKRLRVAEVGYYIGRGKLSHVRLVLK